MGRDMMRLRRGVLLNTPHEEQASGAVASFKTDVSKLKECVVNIEPVQDLNGYDSPWPSGGGKNLADIDSWTEGFVDGTGQRINTTADASNLVSGFIPVEEGVRYTYSTPTLVINPNLSPSLQAKWTGYDFYESADLSTAVGRRIVNGQESFSFVVPKNAKYLVVGSRHLQNGGKVQLEKGSTATAWTPYSNLCPISGWSKANVTRCGKNLTPYSNRGNTTRLWGTSWVNQLALIKTLRPGQYTISAKFTILTNPNNEATVQMGMLLRWKDSDGTWHQIIPYQLQTVAATVGAVYDYSKTFALTDADLAANLEFYLYCGTGTTATTANCYDCQIELGSTATLYAPYTGNQYTIQLGDTVYGGTLDVLGGVLTVDRGYDQMTYSYLSRLTESYIGYNVITGKGPVIWVRNWKYTEIAPRRVGGVFGICNAFPVSVHDSSIFASQYRIYFFVDSNITGVSDFLDVVQTLEANGSGLYLCYELATPFTVQLTPPQLRAIKGQNNIFADTGDVSVKYWKHGG